MLRGVHIKAATRQRGRGVHIARGTVKENFKKKCGFDWKYMNLDILPYKAIRMYVSSKILCCVEKRRCNLVWKRGNEYRKKLLTVSAANTSQKKTESKTDSSPLGSSYQSKPPCIWRVSPPFQRNEGWPRTLHTVHQNVNWFFWLFAASGETINWEVWQSGSCYSWRTLIGDPEVSGHRYSVSCGTVLCKYIRILHYIRIGL